MGENRHNKSRVGDNAPLLDALTARGSSLVKSGQILGAIGLIPKNIIRLIVNRSIRGAGYGLSVSDSRIRTYAEDQKPEGLPGVVTEDFVPAVPDPQIPEPPVWDPMEGYVEYVTPEYDPNRGIPPEEEYPPPERSPTGRSYVSVDSFGSLDCVGGEVVVFVESLGGINCIYGNSDVSVEGTGYAVQVIVGESAVDVESSAYVTRTISGRSEFRVEGAYRIDRWVHGVSDALVDSLGKVSPFFSGVSEFSVESNGFVTCFISGSSEVAVDSYGDSSWTISGFSDIDVSSSGWVTKGRHVWGYSFVVAESVAEVYKSKAYGYSDFDVTSHGWISSISPFDLTFGASEFIVESFGWISSIHTNRLGGLSEFGVSGDGWVELMEFVDGESDFGADSYGEVAVLDPTGENLLTNGGFENGILPWAGSGNLGTLLVTPGRDGTGYGIRTYIIDPLNPDSFATITQPVTVEPGATYLLSFWTRAGNRRIYGWVCRPANIQYEPGSYNDWGIIPPEIPDTEWYYREIQWWAGSSGVPYTEEECDLRVGVGCYNNGSGMGYMYFDDIVFKKIADPA